ARQARARAATRGMENCNEIFPQLWKTVNPFARQFCGRSPAPKANYQAVFGSVFGRNERRPPARPRPTDCISGDIFLGAHLFLGSSRPVVRKVGKGPARFFGRPENNYLGPW